MSAFLDYYCNMLKNFEKSLFFRDIFIEKSAFSPRLGAAYETVAICNSKKIGK